MTVKEIAKAVGKGERAIQIWAKSLSEKNSSISEKISLSSPMTPADYTLDETCLIIEAGMGQDVADVFRTNAQSSTQKTDFFDPNKTKEIRLMLKSGLITLNQAKILALKICGIEQAHDYDESELPDAVKKQVYAVAKTALEKISVQKMQEKRQLRLL